MGFFGLFGKKKEPLKEEKKAEDELVRESLEGEEDAEIGQAPMSEEEMDEK